jgi:hypothetical protein
MGHADIINQLIQTKEITPYEKLEKNKRLDSTFQPRTSFVRNQARQNKKPLPHEFNIKVINGSTWHAVLIIKHGEGTQVIAASR